MSLDVVTLAALGYAVFPCRGKVPLTGHGCKDASTESAVVQAWQSRWPTANWAIATGAKSGGLVVVDVDDVWGEPGAAWTRIANDAGLNGPGGLRTPTVLSGSGNSMHFYFRAPAMAIGNSAGKLAPSVDVRGAGGYVICPPSTHPDGGRYEWVVSPADYRPVKLPRGLVESPHPKPPRRPRTPVRVTATTDPVAARILGEECARVARAGEGTRNATTFAAAAAVGNIVAAGDLVLGEAADALRNAALACGLPEHEAETAVRNGLTQGAETPRRIRTRGGGR